MTETCRIPQQWYRMVQAVWLVAGCNCGFDVFPTQLSHQPGLSPRIGTLKVKEPALNWLRTALSSSVGKKFLMAITGLLLCGFLLTHLAGNLLLLAGPQKYNDYAHALHANEGLLVVAETGLFAIFGLHIYLAFTLSAQNRGARRRGYLNPKAKGEGDGVGFGRPDTWMLVSGCVILVYLIVHVTDFKLEQRVDIEGLTPYGKAVRLLADPVTFMIYMGGQIVLGFHLLHGVISAFQSLGVSHPKYQRCLKYACVAFSLTIAAGFCLLTAWGFTGDTAVESVDGGSSPIEQSAH